ncbi:hypothetical protein D7X33_21105 [Butyricicoccus sp. 1XD8-22]|nr:hypothetical protein D7X33_21105 [Butyricicoccus sp. 1XD8-22]
MKILFVEPTPHYSKLFQDNGLFQCEQAQNLKLLSFYSGEVVVLSEKAVKIHELMDKINSFKEYRYVFYVLEESNKETEDLCRAHRIVPLEANGDIYTTVKKIIYPDNANKNRLFLFFGGDRKAGTTSIVHATAHHLATISTKKVLVISLTGRPNDTFYEFSKSSIDHLRTLISSRVIKFSEILKESEKMQNYQFVAGARDIIQSQLYEVDDIIYLLEVLRKQDDYLVLIDGGGDLYNMLITAALKQVHNRFLVMKHGESYYRQFEAHISQILSVHPTLQLDYSSFQYILNEFDESVDSSANLKDKECVIVGKIPHSYHGRTAENSYNTLHNIDTTFAESVIPIAELIAVKSGTRNEVVTEKKSFFQRLFKSSKVEDGVVHAK